MAVREASGRAGREPGKLLLDSSHVNGGEALLVHLGDQQARGLKVLSRRDCLRLLGRGGVGRIAVPGRSVPTIRPVNFALHDGRIVMRTSDNALWAAATAEVDPRSSSTRSATKTTGPGT